MNKITLKIIKILFLSLLILSGTLNLLWPLDGFRWAYWVSKFLLSGILLVFGASFVVLPKYMMHIVYEDEKDYEAIAHWRLALSGLVVGVSFLVFGAWYFINVWESWIIKCFGLLICYN